MDLETTNGVMETETAEFSPERAPAPATAAQRIAALKKQIEEESETAITELYAEQKTLETRLAEVDAQLAELGAGPTKPAKRKSAAKPAAAPKVADDRPLAARILGVLRHSKEPQRSEQVAKALGEDSKTVSAELKKLVSAEKVRKDGEKRATTYELVAS